MNCCKISLQPSRLIIAALLLTLLSGCFTPQQTVNLRFVDAETNASITQVEATSNFKSWGTTMPGMIPVYRVNPTQRSSWPPLTKQVAGPLQMTIAGNEIVSISKPGYDTLEIEPSLLGIRIQNAASGRVRYEYLLDESTTIPLQKSQDQARDTVEFLPKKRETGE